MIELIKDARSDNSLGVSSSVLLRVPLGLGDPVFDKLEVILRKP